MLNTSSFHKYTAKSLCICLLILSTIFVFGIAITNPGIQGFSRSNIFNMVNGTAYRPYVYRMLVPYIANRILISIPQTTSTMIVQITRNNSVLKSFFADRRWYIIYATEYYVVLTLMYASLWGFVLSFRYLLRGLFKTSERFINIASMLAILGLPSLYWFNTYLYDFMTLFLFTLGLATMLRRKWGLYLFIFTLACINKETTILLTFIYTIHFFKHQKVKFSTYILLLLIQITIYGGIKMSIDMIFIHNTGGIVEFWLKRNVLLLLRPYPISVYLQWAVLGFLVIYKWSEKPLFLKHGLLILIPLFVTMVLWGWIFELRVFYEAYPIVILLMAHSMARIFNVRIHTQLSSDPSYQWSFKTDQPPIWESHEADNHLNAEVPSA